MFGKLSWSAIPIHQPLPMAASLLMMLAVLTVLGIITRRGWWPYLWREWLTSVDHKRIGVHVRAACRWCCCCAASSMRS